MIEAIVDTSALIAFIKNEPGTEQIFAVLPRSAISTINFCEAVTVLRTLNMALDVIESSLLDLVATVIPFDQSQAVLTAALRETTKHKGLSLGDRACIALGMQRQLPIYTADRIWAELGLDTVDIRLIR